MIMMLPPVTSSNRFSNAVVIDATSIVITLSVNTPTTSASSVEAPRPLVASIERMAILKSMKV